ncbi:ABC transporter permease [Prauserella endophytica]|uniref:ABC transporter permease n=1 Tax=Prauserella endophytica TaxID=1592324 RepID=A0ABY2S6Y8_9PSEU|nr:ABC transporter permease [Prauserella endophytica]TKG71694.1 ABC transporter permease [Prauserella endophytica]
MMPHRRHVLPVFAVLLAVTIVLPILAVIPVSFTPTSSFAISSPESWSPRWYRELLTNPVWLDSLVSSLRIALLAALVATVAGTMAALGLRRVRRTHRVVARALVTLPLLIPLVVLAVGLYAMLIRTQLVGTTAGFVLAHALLGLPLAFITVSASLDALDDNLEQASRGLGAGPVTTMRLIVLPLVAPGVIAGALFAFVVSFNEVVIAGFLGSPYLRTLPIEMYSSMTRSTDPTVAAAATFVAALTVITAAFALAAMSWRRRHLTRKD